MTNNNQNKTFKVKSQAGLSLLELMISMLVSLFLLAGVVTNFISITDSDLKRDAVSEMDANAGEAFRVLRKAITHAGYRSIENTILEDDMAFFTGTADLSHVTCSNNDNRDKAQVLGNKGTRDDDEADFLTVISLADNPCVTGESECSSDSTKVNPNALVYTDCNGGGELRDAHSVACSTNPSDGMSNPPDAKIFNSFWLKRESGDEDRTLNCRGSRSSSEEVVVHDVEAIQYLYGVRNEAGSTTFRTADEVSNQWPMVISVQIGLLMRSSNQYVLDEVSTKTEYGVLDKEITIATDDLRRLFRVYTTTIYIENRNTGALL